MEQKIVLGGGISSLAFLVKYEGDTILVDKNISLGGLSRSVYLDDAVFDYTGHLLHLKDDKSPSQLVDSIDDSQWHKISREVSCLVNGNLTQAPFQYNLFDLPDNIRDEYLT